MNATKAIRRFLLILLFVPVIPCFAGEVAQQELAKILMNFHHFANDEQKAKLNTLASDSSLSDPERTIAQALLGVKHWPSDEDKAKLNGIASDSDVPDAVRELARIVHDLKHQISDTDRQELSAMISQ